MLAALITVQRPIKHKFGAHFVKMNYGGRMFYRMYTHGTDSDR